MIYTRMYQDIKKTMGNECGGILPIVFLCSVIYSSTITPLVFVTALGNASFAFFHGSF